MLIPLFLAKLARNAKQLMVRLSMNDSVDKRLASQVDAVLAKVNKRLDPAHLVQSSGEPFEERQSVLAKLRSAARSWVVGTSSLAWFRCSLFDFNLHSVLTKPLLPVYH